MPSTPTAAPSRLWHPGSIETMMSDRYATLPDRPPLRSPYLARLRSMIHRVAALNEQIRRISDHCERLVDAAPASDSADRDRDLLHLQERIAGVKACAEKVTSVLHRLEERPS